MECISYFSHYCGQRFGKRQLPNRSICSGSNLRGCSLLWGRGGGGLWQQVWGSSHLNKPRHTERGMMVLIWLSHFLFIKSELPAHVTVLPMFRGSLPSSIISPREHRHIHPQKCVSWVALNPIKLMTKMNSLSR